MKKLFLLNLLLASAALAAPSSDTIPAQGGPIKITALFHASTQIEYRGKVILVDPISAASLTKKADLILITHTHPDHLDLAAIGKASRRDTILVGPSALRKLNLPNFIPQKNGDTTVAHSVPIASVPAYNLVRGPKEGQKYHPKGEFNGYVLTLGGKRLYFAGDTEFIPEMKPLKHIDAAFLPMNLPFTMTPQEAANAAKSFGPKVVYPYHFRYPFDKANDNPQQFWKALQGTKIKVKMLDYYPEAAVKKAMKK